VQRLRLEDHEFEASLGYTVRFCVKNKQRNTKTYKKVFVFNLKLKFNRASCIFSDNPTPSADASRSFYRRQK
jgi:hypothetical protein